MARKPKLPKLFKKGNKNAAASPQTAGPSTPQAQGSPSQVSRTVSFGGNSVTYNAVPGQQSDTDSARGSPAATSKASPTSKPKKKDKRKKKQKSQQTSASNTALQVTRKPSPVLAPLPVLTNAEYDFFEMVRTGEAPDVAEFFTSGEFAKLNMSINKLDKKGYTVLHYAVIRQDEPMVKLLLEQEGILLFDTILHAIKEENLVITKLLLEHFDKTRAAAVATPSTSTANVSIVVPLDPRVSPTSGVIGSVSVVFTRSLSSRLKSTKSRTPGSSTSQISATSVNSDEDEEFEFDSEFHEKITPLMLAAQVDCEPLIELFYDRGERLQTPELHHNMGCACDTCRKVDGDQNLTRAYQRYHLFKALVSPAYICFLSHREKIDPVNYAIQRIIMIKNISNADPAFSPLFKEFPTELEEFMCKLLKCCRSTQEVEIFMSPKDEEDKEGLPHLHPRLWYTVGLKLKDFVAEPNCQTLVYKLWATDDWPEWETYNRDQRLKRYSWRVLSFWAIAILLWANPGAEKMRNYRAPVSKFLNYYASYAFFFALVTFQALWPYQRCNSGWSFTNLTLYQVHDSACKERGPPSVMTEWPIIIYVISFYVTIWKRQSISWYWHMRWNYLELLSQIFFTITFAFWGYSWYEMRNNIDNENYTANDRLMWPHDSPEILSECFLSVSVLLASMRFLRICTPSMEMGPMQIRLGYMVGDFLKVCIILIVVIFAFASGMMAIYMPYKGFHGLDLEDCKREKLQEDAFQEKEGALKTFFFTLYEHGGPDVTRVLAWNINNGTSVELIHHHITEMAGLFIYVCYAIIGGTMVFSMVSGYFSHRDEKFEERVGEEWRFARTELYLTFVKDTKLPPPFNLIPTLETLTSCLRCLKFSKEDPMECSFRRCCYFKNSEKAKAWKKLNKKYRKLVLQLIFRYKNMMEDEEGEEHASKDDVLEIGEELAEIKAKLKKSKNEVDDGGGDDNDNPHPPPPPPPPDGGGDMNNLRGLTSDDSNTEGGKGWSKAKTAAESNRVVEFLKKSSEKTKKDKDKDKDKDGGGGSGGSSVAGGSPTGSLGSSKTMSNTKSAPVLPQLPPSPATSKLPSAISSQGGATGGTPPTPPRNSSQGGATVKTPPTTPTRNPSKGGTPNGPTPSPSTPGGSKMKTTSPSANPSPGGRSRVQTPPQSGLPSPGGVSKRDMQTPPPSGATRMPTTPTTAQPSPGGGSLRGFQTPPPSAQQSQPGAPILPTTTPSPQLSQTAVSSNSALPNSLPPSGNSAKLSMTFIPPQTTFMGCLDLSQGNNNWSPSNMTVNPSLMHSQMTNTQTVQMMMSSDFSGGLATESDGTDLWQQSQGTCGTPQNPSSYLQQSLGTSKSGSGRRGSGNTYQSPSKTSMQTEMAYGGGYCNEPYNEPRRGSRSGGGLEVASAGMRDYSGFGEDGTYQSALPTNINSKLNEPVPNISTGQPFPASRSQVSQKPTYTNLNMNPSNYQEEPRRGSRSGGGLECGPMLQDFSEGWAEDNTLKQVPTAHYSGAMPESSRRPSGDKSQARVEFSKSTNNNMQLSGSPQGTSKNSQRRDSIKSQMQASGTTSAFPSKRSSPPWAESSHGNNHIQAAMMTTHNTGLIDVWGTPIKGSQLPVGKSIKVSSPTQNQRAVVDSLNNMQSYNGNSTQVRYKGGNEAYSPSKSPSVVPSKTQLPSNMIAAPSLSSDDTGNATDGSSRVNYDFSDDLTPLNGDFKLYESRLNY